MLRTRRLGPSAQMCITINRYHNNVNKTGASENGKYRNSVINQRKVKLARIWRGPKPHLHLSK